MKSSILLDIQDQLHMKYFIVKIKGKFQYDFQQNLLCQEFKGLA